MKNNGKNIAPLKLVHIKKEMERALMGCRKVTLEYNRWINTKGQDTTISKSTMHRAMTSIGIYDKDEPKEHQHIERPSEPFQSFAMDFKEKVIAGGDRIHVLDVIDEYNNAINILDAHRRANADSVIKSLQPFVNVFRWRKIKMRSDNGREFQNEDVIDFCIRNNISLDFVPKGQPWNNAFVERNIRTVTEECLNLRWINGIDDAQKILTEYKHKFNRRENMGIGYKTPLQKMWGFHAAQMSNM